MRREKRLSIMLAACVGLLFLVFLWMVIKPTWSNMSSKADEQTRLKNKAEAELREAKSLDPKEVQAKLDNLKSRVPNSLELPNVIARVSGLASQNQLVWLSGTPTEASTDVNGTPTEATAAPQLDRHDFTIVVSGSNSNFLSFMAGLTDKNIGRIIVIDSVDVQFKPDAGPDAVEVTLKLQVIGWSSGSSIDADGCAQESISGDSKYTSDDPKCNTTNVSKGK